MVLTLALFLVSESPVLVQCPDCSTDFDHCLELFGCNEWITEIEKCYMHCMSQYKECKETANCRPNQHQVWTIFKPYLLKKNHFLTKVQKFFFFDSPVSGSIVLRFMQIHFMYEWTCMFTILLDIIKYRITYIDYNVYSICMQPKLQLVRDDESMLKSCSYHILMIICSYHLELSITRCSSFSHIN